MPKTVKYSICLITKKCIIGIISFFVAVGIITHFVLSREIILRKSIQISQSTNGQLILNLIQVRYLIKFF